MLMLSDGGVDWWIVVEQAYVPLLKSPAMADQWKSGNQEKVPKNELNLPKMSRKNGLDQTVSILLLRIHHASRDVFFLSLCI